MGYDDHLDRAMEEKPDVAGSTSRFSVPDPVIRVEGNFTVFENFHGTADRLGRDDAHLKKYLQNELGTAASIDESGRLRLTGDFREERVRDALEAYADAFVLCPECGLPDTRLTVEQGTELLRCEACGTQSPAGG